MDTLRRSKAAVAAARKASAAAQVNTKPNSLPNSPYKGGVNNSNKAPSSTTTKDYLGVTESNASLYDNSG